MEEILRPAVYDRDVFANEGIDTLERPAVGVEAQVVAWHGGGATAYRVPGGGQVSENGHIQSSASVAISELAAKQETSLGMEV